MTNHRNAETRVFNLSTGEETVFSLPPEEAVVAAYHTLTRKDINWWDWPKTEIIRGHHTVACGDWCAIVNG